MIVEVALVRWNFAAATAVSVSPGQRKWQAPCLHGAVRRVLLEQRDRCFPLVIAYSSSSTIARAGSRRRTRAPKRRAQRAVVFGAQP